MIKRKKKPQEQIDKEKEESQKMKDFFLSIWNEKFPHNCENCNVFLGNSPKTYMFDHVLPKSKYEELKFEKENIMYLCLDCHARKTNGYHSDKIMDKIQQLRIKYNIE